MNIDCKIAINCKLFSETTRLLIKVWIDAGFGEKSLNEYNSVRVKVNRIWTEAKAAVHGGSAANRSKVKQKILNSSEAVVEILACRYTYIAICCQAWFLSCKSNR